MDLRSVLVLTFTFAVAYGAGWAYHGVNGTDHWKDIVPTCGGSKQSPIDLVTSKAQQDTSMGRFVTTNFDKTDGIKWLLTNNGHTVQVTYQYDVADNTVNVSGGGLTGTYTVAQFHFHWGSDSTKGSEHTWDGKEYPMELHIVTYNNKYHSLSAAVENSDGLAVLGFFFEIQADDNPRIATLVNEFVNITKPESSSDYTTPFALDDFVADMTDYFRYSGSLTTPECNEVVTWTVFTKTIKLSEGQMEKFRGLKEDHEGTAALEDNYRPVQVLGGRMIKTTFNPVSDSSSTIVFSAITILSCLLVSIFGRF